jgi:hypothetical protein
VGILLWMVQNEMTTLAIVSPWVNRTGSEES